MRKKILFYLLALFIFSCNRNEFSPNQKFDATTPEDVNAREISELSKKTAGAHIRIAVSGDTHTDYTDSKGFVDYVNSQDDIDFVVLNGDITNFGLLTEFQGIYDIYNKLKVPFITVLGNHDENAEGNFVYQRMYGSPNFTFDYGGIKFVCHDANSREHSFDHTTPNLDWLRMNLSKDGGTQYIMAFSHVPPIDADFDQTLRSGYENLFNSTPGMLASVHSHRHSADSIYRANGTGIPFIITNTILNKTFTIIDITNGQLTTHPVTF